MADQTRAYRIPQHLLEHVEFAHQDSGLSRTAIVRKALEMYLNKTHPLPGAPAADKERRGAPVLA